MLEEKIRQSAFKLCWEREQKSQALIRQDEFSSMREWQTEAFDILKDAPLMILNAPMGSGKSWLMCLLSAFKLRKNNSLRCIIGIPQTIIAPGFVKAKLVMPNGEKVDWSVRHNLCSESSSGKSTVKTLIHWLEQPHVDFHDRVLLCTHATLLRVYIKLKEEGRLELLRDLLLWMDEAHHLMNIASEEFPDKVDNNGIGKLVEYLLKQSGKNIEIGLTTASFFRGDRKGLLTQEMEKQFSRYNLPYDTYLKSMENLESFGFDFLICGYDYIKGIELLIKQRKGKDIIYIPHPNSQHSTRDKCREVEHIINKYKAVHGEIEKRTEDGLTVLEKGANTFKIIDLVDDHSFRRNQRKNYIHNPILKEDPSALDAIIALNMFKEGANWIWADRSIIVGARSSLVDIIQMIGRVFRDAKDKKHVEVIQLLPFSLDQKNETEFRENLNDYLKAIYASLILENILDPVKIKIPSMRPEKDIGTEGQKNIDRKEFVQDWLKLAVPDESKQHSLIENVGNQLMNIKSERKEPMTWHEHQNAVSEILENNGIHQHKEEIAQQILGMFTRKTLRLQGIAVETIDFEILKIGEPLEFLLRYTSGSCNIDTFKQLRDAIQLSRTWRPFEEARKWIQELKLTSETQWRAYIAGERSDLPVLPDDIPRAPWVAYENRGWLTWGDFLGTNITAPRLRQYRLYEDAREFAHALQLKRKEDWPLYTKGQFPHLPPLPNDIAVCPDKTYRRKDYGQKWNGWGDFLGTNSVSNQNKSKIYLSYKDAHDWVKALNLKSSVQWRKYIAGEMPHLPTLPPTIPKKPDKYFENFEWTEFLGYKSSRYSQKEFWDFDKARQFVCQLGLKRFYDWVDYCAGKFPDLPSKPMEVPSNPQKIYQNTGWQNYAHWMGY
jgi:hypothetical protein